MTSTSRHGTRRLVLAGIASALLLGGTVAFVYARVSQDEAPRLATHLALAPGLVVADVGAGRGQLAAGLAAIVGPMGHVYATELDADRLDDLRERVAREALGHVTVVEAAVDGTNLPDACCDAIVLRHVYHHILETVPMNRSLLESLRPGGRLAIIDFAPSRFLGWFASADARATERGHGITSELVVDELRDAGFEIVLEEPDWSGWSYLVVARRPAPSES